MSTATLINYKGAPIEAWGLLPTFLDDDDPSPVREQLGKGYGSWKPFQGFELTIKPPTLTYPDDPPMRPLSAFEFRGELVLLFPHSWVLVMQKDGTWEVARMD